jgi:CRP/FNR family transcriptional regulator, cyclic AMP receptor protein
LAAVLQQAVVTEDITQFFPAGHRFFKKGDHGEVMYVVTSGEVEISLRGKVLEIVPTGSVFGEMAIIDDAERSAEAIAKTDVKVVVIDQARFYYLTRSDPGFALRVMKIITNRLRKLNELL